MRATTDCVVRIFRATSACVMPARARAFTSASASVYSGFSRSYSARKAGPSSIRLSAS
jgi:hypothetical protein